MRISAIAMAVSLTLAGLSVAQDSKAAIKAYAIAPQSISTALREFAAQSELQLIYTEADVRATQTAGVKGELVPAAALSEMLKGTGLEYEITASNVVVVRRVGAGKTSFSYGGKGGIRLAQGESSESSGKGEEDASKLGEIVVTATKREERIQDVPMSITAITGAEIQRRGLVSSQDYLRGIPGVNQVEAPYGQAIVIRGIETSTANQNIGSGATVATYFGETPITNTAGLGQATNIDLKLIDIERIEVLRGPQGTSFGNSSMGGAVRTIPVAPRLDSFEAKMAAGYSATSGTGGDNYNVQAVGNIPLVSDKVALRAVLYRYEDSGFYRNRAGSDAAYQAAVVDRYGAQAFASDYDEVGSSTFTGGRVAALFQASDDLRLTLSYLNQRTNLYGFAGATSGSYGQTILQPAPEHVIRGHKEGFTESEIDIGNAAMEYNMGWGDLLASYSYTKSGTIAAVNSSILPYGAQADGDHLERVSEIRVTSRLDGPWNFIGGLYAENVDDDYLAQFAWYGDLATNPFGSATRQLGYFPNQRGLKQKAAFGEVSWKFLPRLTFTGGVRAYKYSRTYNVDAEGTFYGPAGIHINEGTNANGETFRANLSYKIAEDALLYAGWSQGFRLGQLQNGIPPGRCDRDGDGLVDGTNITIESSRRVNSDDLDSYEIGGKFTLLDRRATISAAAFRMEWANMPVRFTAGTLATGCGLGYNANAGKARSEGVEFQASFRVGEPIRVDLGGSWVHARLTQDILALHVPKGNRLPGSPEVNASVGLQYDFEFIGHRAFIRADSVYIGSFHGDVQESADTEVGDYIKIDATTGVELGNLTIDLFAQNLTNRDNFTFRGPFTGNGDFGGFQLRPRTIGVRFGYTFDSK